MEDLVRLLVACSCWGPVRSFVHIFGVDVFCATTIPLDLLAGSWMCFRKITPFLSKFCLRCVMERHSRRLRSAPNWQQCWRNSLTLSLGGLSTFTMGCVGRPWLAQPLSSEQLLGKRMYAFGSTDAKERIYHQRCRCRRVNSGRYWQIVLQTRETLYQIVILTRHYQDFPPQLFTINHTEIWPSMNL